MEAKCSLPFRILPRRHRGCRWNEIFPAWLSGYAVLSRRNPGPDFQVTIENFPTAYWVEWQNCLGPRRARMGHGNDPHGPQRPGV